MSFVEENNYELTDIYENAQWHDENLPEDDGLSARPIIKEGPWDSKRDNMFPQTSIYVDLLNMDTKRKTTRDSVVQKRVIYEVVCVFRGLKNQKRAEKMMDTLNNHVTEHNQSVDATFMDYKQMENAVTKQQSISAFVMRGIVRGVANEVRK